jgi:hypothetical protein
MRRINQLAAGAGSDRHTRMVCFEHQPCFESGAGGYREWLGLLFWTGLGATAAHGPWTGGDGVLEVPLGHDAKFKTWFWRVTCFNWPTGEAVLVVLRRNPSVRLPEVEAHLMRGGILASQRHDHRRLQWCGGSVGLLASVTPIRLPSQFLCR